MAIVLADTSALYALFDRKDQNHQAAVQFYDQQLSFNTRFIVIEYVLVELMTLLRKRGYTAFAVQFRESLSTSQIFMLQYSSPEFEEETFRVFRSFTDKSWSYTDCALFVTAKHLGNVPVFSFDHHITQMGLIRLPREGA